MSTSVYRTFQNIYEAVIKDAKESTTTVNVVDLVKRWINEGYEVVNFRKKRTYLDKHFVLSLKGKVEDTFTVTNGSSLAYHTGTATLLSGSLELGFKISGYEENYDIESITGTIAVLTTTFKGTTNSAATGTLFQKAIILDQTVSEVYQAWHDYYRNPLQNDGPQKLRETITYYPEIYDKATRFAILGQDTTTGGRRLEFWPYPDVDYTLYFDANIYPEQLILAADEPLIPQQYRQVLYWFGLGKLFGTYHRNTEREQICNANFAGWLAKIDGLDEVSQDYARLMIDYRRPKRYVRARAFDPRFREDPSS